MEIEDLLGIEYLYGIEEILYKKLEIQILKISGCRVCKREPS